MNMNTLLAALKAASPADVGLVLAKLRASRDDLQKQIIAALNANPPADTDDLSADFVRVNTWIRTLEAAVQPAPPGNADAALLSAMQAVDAASAGSAAMSSLLTAIDGIVKSF